MSEFPQRATRRWSTRAAALAVETAIERIRQVRRWRDLVGVPAGAVLEARIGERSARSSSRRLARLSTIDGAAARRWRRSARSRSSPRATIDADAGRGADRRASAGSCAAEIERARAQARQRGLRRQGAAGRGRRRAREARAAIGAELDALLSLDRPHRRRGLPRLARAARDAVRARADPQARLGAGHAAAPLRLRPRRRHQRQVVGDRDDRGAARGARGRRRRLPLAPRRALGGADPDRRRGDRARARSGPRSSGSPRASRRSTGRSTRASR